MKMSNKDKTLLFILALVFSTWGYFSLLVGPQHAKIEQLQQNRNQYDGKLLTEGEYLSEKQELSDTYLTKLDDLINLQSAFFVGFDYGDVLSLLSTATSKHGISILSLEMGERVEISLEDESQYMEDEFYFDEEEGFDDDEVNGLVPEDDLMEEESEGRAFEEISVTIEFIDDFETVMALLEEIQTNDKLINIESFDMKVNESKLIEVKLVLMFYGVCSLLDDQDYAQKPDENAITVSNPFAFIGTHVSEAGATEEERTQLDEEKQVATIEIGPSRVVLNEFEKADNIFVTKNKKIRGRTSKDTNSWSGNYSLRLEYDFSRAQDSKEATVLFTNEITIPLLEGKLAIWIYSPAEVDHSIELITIDSQATKHITTITNAVNWVGWEQKIVNFADETIYPVRIVGMSVSSKKRQDAIHNVLLFDRMELQY